MVRTIVVVVALMGLGACHRVSYTTNRPQGQTTTVWNNFYALGLIGHATIDTRELCPAGVARIISYQHIHHILLTTITIGIYAPRSVQVVCAAASPPGDGPPGAGEKSPGSEGSR